MPTPYDDILRTVVSLAHDEQLRLISDVAERLRRHAGNSARTSILELQGLGREIWQGIDAQDYVDHERAAWNG